MTHYRSGTEGYCPECNRIEATYPNGELYHHYSGVLRDYGQVDSATRCKGSGRAASPMPDTPEVEAFAFKEVV